METFMKVYERNLLIAVQEHPEEYDYGPDFVATVLTRMRPAIENGTFNKQGHAFKRTCKELGIKNTYKDIQRFIDNHV